MNYQGLFSTTGQLVANQNNIAQIANNNTYTNATQQAYGNGEQYLNRNGIESANKTLLKLNELEKEIRELSTFGSACDELHTMLEEKELFTEAIETGLIKCVTAVREKANEYGPWSGIKVLKQVKENSSLLSEQGQKFITCCYNELNEIVFGVKTTLTPTPTAQTTPVVSTVDAISIPNSPASISSAPNSNTSLNVTHLFNTLSRTFSNRVDSTQYTDPSSPAAKKIKTSQPSDHTQGGLTRSHQSSPQQQQQQLHRTLQAQYLQQQQQKAQQQQQQQQQIQHLQQQQQMQHRFHIQQQQQQQQPQRQYIPHPAQTAYNNMQLYNQNAQILEAQMRNNYTPASTLQQQQQQQQQQHYLHTLQNKLYFQQHNAQAQSAPYAASPPIAPTNNANYGQQSQQQPQQQQPQMISPNNPPSSPTYAQLQKNQMNSAAQGGGGSPRSAFNQAVQLPPRASPPLSPTTATHPQRHLAPSSPLTTQIQPPEATNANHSQQQQQVMSPGLARTTATPNISVFFTQKQATQPQHPPQPQTPTQVPTPPQSMYTPPAQPVSQVPTLPPIQIQLQTPPQRAAGMPRQDGLPRQGANPAGFNIVLPGGPRSNRLLLPQEVAKYKSAQGQAIKTFQLEHGQNLTKKPFFISRDDYKRLYTGSLTRAFIDPNLLPLTYILNSWHNDSPSTKCDWPGSLKVELNGRILTLEKRKRIVVHNRPPTIAGKDKPYDLSPLLKEGQNMLVLHQVECACVGDETNSYNFSIDMYIRESEEIIQAKVKNNIISLSQGEELVDTLLGAGKKDADDEDIEIIQESIRLSLRCPISLLRIVTPVKGITCKHPNCFELDSFLQVNESGSNQWRCPHCNNPIPPRLLAKDMFFNRLLETVPKRAREIEITGDHSNYKIIKIDDESDDEGDNSEDEQKLDRAILEATEQVSNVIDLLSDSDEE